MVYPRPGLPAVAWPGARIVTRVRVAAPLTPPPGIQQPRALYGWTAELRGHADLVAQGAEWRYRLRVRDVRPDAQASLIYRATISIPPFAAPGVYTLVLSAPRGGRSTSVASVVVLDSSRPVRLAVLRNMEVEPASLRRDPAVDVWVVHDPEATRSGLRSPLASSGAPWLNATIAGAELRLSDRRVVHVGGCQPFATPRLDGLETHEPAANGQRTWVVVRERDASIPRGVTQWFMATPVRPVGHRPSIVGVGNRDSLEEARSVAQDGNPSAPSGPRLPIVVPSHTILAGRDAHFRARAPAGANVAWAWDEDGAGYGEAARAQPIRFARAGDHEVHAVAITPQGQPLRGSVRVRVQSHVETGCSAVSSNGLAAAHLAKLGWFGIFALGVLRWLLCRIGRPRYKG